MMPLPIRRLEEVVLVVSVPDARGLSDEVVAASRLRALRGCAFGYTEEEIATLLGVCRETVCQWWSAYTQGGLAALPHDRTGRPQGSGRLLSAAQAERIQQLLRTHSPG
jgi:transposase